MKGGYAVLCLLFGEPKAAGPFRHRAEALVRQFAIEFPERADQLSVGDLMRYQRLFLRWQELFSHYDIVHAYSTDPILPLLAGCEYFAFEHGTLREIPFENSIQGRTTSHAYRLARHVFVTNHDCLEAGRYFARDRVTFINHPYDESQALESSGWERQREDLQRSLDATFLFFFPTRHDWQPWKTTADKANDVFLRAFCELRRLGHPVGLVCCEWGLDLRESKRLIEELGCSRFVRWEPPMGIVRFNRFTQACHVVVDQFKIGALGGVAFKALAVGAPLLTYLDETAIAAVYPEVPPVVNCRSTEQIVQAAAGLIGDPGRLAQIADASRCWIGKYHAATQTVELQLTAYSRAYSAHHA